MKRGMAEGREGECEKRERDRGEESWEGKMRAREEYNEAAKGLRVQIVAFFCQIRDLLGDWQIGQKAGLRSRNGCRG
jgi:hypothetical protein